MGHVQERGCLVLGPLAPAIVAAGGGRIGVAGHLLDGDDVGPGVQQVADEGAAKVVGREAGNPGHFGPFAEHVVDGLVGQRPAAVAVAQAPEERPGFAPADGQPIGQRRGDVAHGHGPLLVALAAYDKLALFYYIVAHLQGDQLGPAQPAAVEDGNDGCVANPQRPGFATVEQCGQLAG